MKPFHAFQYPLLLSLSFLVLLAGCGGSAPAGTASSGDANPEKHKLTIMLDWYPNAVHSFLYAAQEKGYFAEQGLEVEIRMPAETNDPLKLAAAGKIDLALTYQPQVLMARNEQIPVRSIAAVVRHPLNHLLVPKTGSVQRPKDLAGKTAGYSSIPVYEAMLRTMVKHDGGSPDDVQLIDVGYDLIPALATGRVDGIMGGFINHEALILEKEGHPVTSIDPAQYGVPDYYELVISASDQTIDERQEDLKRFLSAAAKGQQFVAEHPGEALDILLKHEDQTSPLDKDIETRSLELLLPLMDAGKQPFGYQDPEVWSSVRQWLVDNALIKESAQAEDGYISLH